MVQGESAASTSGVESEIDPALIDRTEAAICALETALG